MDLKKHDIEAHIQDTFDVFIGSASYENRCLTFYNAIKHHLTFKHKIISISTPHRNLFQDKIDFFIAEGFKPIEVSYKSQLESVENLGNCLMEILRVNERSSFLIDVSTFTRQTLLILLRLLRNFLMTSNKIQFAYTKAADYAIGLQEDDKWLTRGIIQVESVFGYLGIIRPSRKYHLIILMGYEVERAASLINAYEPSRITIGIAKMEDSNPIHYGLNKKRFEELLSEFPNATKFEFSSSNSESVKDEILALTENFKDYNTVISPMHNKISTIGCALAAFADKSIQLAIAVPAVYNSDAYSLSSEEYMMFELPGLFKA